MTAFQTPFGLHRLVKLPMGWTNSVPIFHDDVTYIMRDEIPHITIPYIDDVPLKGPASRYETADGGYETIPENPGIRCFFWEHLNNCNRIVQRLKYAGGTFSGKKTFLCNPEAIVVGHKCTYEGREPGEKATQVIREWPIPKNLTELRSFLGTAGQLRMFVWDYARISTPLNKLTGNHAWEWGEKQTKAFEQIKENIVNAPPLKAVNYNHEKGITLGVDTSYIAVGYFLAQEDEKDPKKKNYLHFGSITLSETEAAYSQPKRELYGLKLALEDAEHILYGCRNLKVLTDASYIKGMLNNPSRGPNATINRWIEEIRKFQFELVHIKGSCHKLADGLSRRPATECSIKPRATAKVEDDEEVDDDGLPLRFSMAEGETEEPFEFEDFKHLIDHRGGYYHSVATTELDLEDDIQLSREEELRAQRARIIMAGKMGVQIPTSVPEFDSVVSKTEGITVQQFVQSPIGLVPNEDWLNKHPYAENHRTKEALSWDRDLSIIKEYLSSPNSKSILELPSKHKRKVIARSKQFFIDEEGRLYRKNSDNSEQPLLVVPKDKRMYMMHSAHDHLGHKGVYATESIISKRFWWPDLEKDVQWFVSSCEPCQARQMRLPRQPPTLTYTPTLFQRVHVDVMKMSPASNGCNNIVHGRCALSRWSEGRALKRETARAIAEWFFEDIICRWGTPEEVITDNAPQMKAVLLWLEEKYGVTGITISPYNSQANGTIERAHLDIRQALAKATAGDLSKWFWFLKPVLWADRVTPRKGLGCSPYFIVLGAEPLLPFDIVESTWLVKLPNRILTTDELIGYRAQALARHRVHVQDMIDRVSERKLSELRKFEKKYRHVIKDWDFKPGTLVQVRNTRIEKNLDRKMYPRYLGPMIVIKRSRGGAYILAEMDGTVLREKVAAFRVLPHKARYEPIELPANIHDLIDLNSEQLKTLVEDNSTELPWSPGKDYIFEGMPNMKVPVYDNNGEVIEDNVPIEDIATESGNNKDVSTEIENLDGVGEDSNRITRSKTRKK